MHCVDHVLLCYILVDGCVIMLGPFFERKNGRLSLYFGEYVTRSLQS
jgi:hypothetical protein